MRQKVTIKFQPDNLEKAYLYENGKKIETIYPVKKIDNSKMKRKSISYASLEGRD